MDLGNVLIIRPGALGDAVLTLPVLTALSRAHAARSSDNSNREDRQVISVFVKMRVEETGTAVAQTDGPYASLHTSCC